MLMKTIALMAVAAVTWPPSTVFAQTLPERAPVSPIAVRSASAESSVAALRVPERFSVTLDAAEAAQARSSLPSRGYFARAFGGVWVGSGEGFVLGGGIAFLPVRDNQHEINANVAYQRVESTNGFGVDVNYLYNFTLQGEGFTPYVGAGINVAHFSSDTEAALQLGGGIKRPLNNGRELFVEAFFPFFYDTPLIGRVGLAW